MKLEIQNVSCGYHTRPVVRNISFQLSSGEVVCLLGPNGVGKTTLFKSVLGLLRPLGGRIVLDGRDLHSLRKKDVAKVIAYMPQSHTPPFPFTVLDVVIVGRTAYMGRFASPSKSDYILVESIMERLEILSLRNRIYTELSGGERQMVLIARALTQLPHILMMDEPTASLDFGNQARVLGQIKALAKEGLAVLMTSHDPDHAFLCSTKAVLLKKKGEISIGSVEEVVTEENLSDAYGIRVKISSVKHSPGKKTHSCVPILEE
jgi:iron complex transport system ATP-binding protein